jgi:hypothetical protein
VGVWHADVLSNGRRLRVFQYWADIEDALPECQFLTIADFGFFNIKNVSTNACYGEVWTDENFNILRMSLHLELPGKWQDYQSVVAYDWLRRRDDAPWLVPASVAAQAKYGRKLYWCRGRFMNYQVFSSQVKMAVN